MNQWHKLSQVAGNHLLETSTYPFCPAIEDLAYGHLVTKSTYNAMGIMHGAAWHVLAHKSTGATGVNATTWDLLSTMCPHVSFMFPHGIGHGLLTTTYGACDEVPLAPNGYDSLLQAVRTCNKMPAYFDFYCSEGAYHGSVEYIHYEPKKISGDNVFFPCSEFPRSFKCFESSFGQGLYMQGRDFGPNARYHSFAQLTKATPVPQTCFMIPMAERNVRGCIWGLSATHFIFYHETWSEAQRGGDKESMKKACFRVPAGTVNSFSDIGCPMLFSATFPPWTTSTSSLVDWCSIAVPTEAQSQISGRDLRRWMACVHGVFNPIVRGDLLLRYETPLRERFCKHNLPSQGDAIWREVEKWCFSLFTMGLYDTSTAWTEATMFPPLETLASELVDLLA